MDGLLVGLAALVVIVLIAIVVSSARRFAVRPGDNEFVQSTWAEHRELRNQAINGGFWRFIAKLEFVLLMGLGTYVSITGGFDWYYSVIAGFLCFIGVIALFS